MKVTLLDFMGCDEDIVRAAKVSYDNYFEEEISEEKIDKLIRRLWWLGHTSPFEMVEFKFFVEVPLFVARQMVRHRTASMNEISRRYSSKNISFYPITLREQDDSMTKQGSGQDIVNPVLDDLVGEYIDKGEELYHFLLDNNASRETAREMLPLNLMTRFVWKMDLRNLLHFIKLRSHWSAQKEVQFVAQEMLDHITPIVPITVKAFEQWRKLMDEFILKGYEYFRDGIEVSVSFNKVYKEKI
jgi:thymidylate synthase (FAD)